MAKPETVVVEVTVTCKVRKFVHVPAAHVTEWGFDDRALEVISSQTPAVGDGWDLVDEFEVEFNPVDESCPLA